LCPLINSTLFINQDTSRRLVPLINSTPAFRADAVEVLFSADEKLPARDGGGRLTGLAELVARDDFKLRVGAAARRQPTTTFPQGVCTPLTLSAARLPLIVKPRPPFPKPAGENAPTSLVSAGRAKKFSRL
jgi:hypothetical protein